MSPLVSCIMPTANRRRFVPRAIAQFLRQDYPRRELVIVDDGDEPIHDLVPAAPDIRFYRLPRPLALGAKRNLACECARGDLILHWDDDDWMAPQRIRCQVQALLQHDAEICGLRQLYFYNLQTRQSWLYDYPAGLRPWLAGGSLLYTRNFWEQSKFPEIQIGEDARFLWSRDIGRIAVPPDNRFYVAMIHPDNTSPKICTGAYWKPAEIDLEALMNGGAAIKLNLGCCDAPLPGYVNVDLVPAAGVDQVADLSQPWPWPDDSIEFIRAWDIIEHLPDKIQTMNEMWRVLRAGGRAEIVVPTTEGSGAFQDPTHVSFWNSRSFRYYEAGNIYRERFTVHYKIRAKFRILSERTDSSVDGPRLTILLEAVKP